MDEEQFPLLTGFNDIFVTIAAVILLVAVAWIGQFVGPQIERNGPSPVAGLFVAASAWGLAEYFTRERRMALPSIVLLVFVGGVFAACAFTIGLIVGPDRFNDNDQLTALVVAGPPRSRARGLAALAALPCSDNGRRRRGRPCRPDCRARRLRDR